jgi:rare lipoprotein A
MGGKGLWRGALLAAIGFMLVGCGSANYRYSATGPRNYAPHPTYKIGAPYSVKGVTYYPHVDLSYDRTGTASWYGEAFQGEYTANGEVYDLNQITAAHKTLPLPSIVEVTNLQNNRALRVRINDRGPFADGRIIDLSRRAAQLLGFERSGTAMVRVRILPAESLQAEAAAARGIVSNGSSAYAAAAPAAAPVVVAAAAPRAAPAPSHPPVAAVPPPSVVGPVASPSAIPPAGSPAPPAPPAAGFAAAATGAQPAVYQPAAQNSEPVPAAYQTSQPQQVAAQYPPPQYGTPAPVYQRLPTAAPAAPSRRFLVQSPLYRMEIGPVATQEEADRALSRMLQSGYRDARIVMD